MEFNPDEQKDHLARQRLVSFDDRAALADYEAATPGLIEARDAIDRDYPTRYCRDCSYMHLPYPHADNKTKYDDAVCLHPGLGDAVTGNPLPCRHNRYYGPCGVVGQHFEPKA